MSKNTQTDASDGSEIKPEFPENSYLSENEKSFFESEQEPQEFNVLDTRYTFIYQCPLCFYKDRYLKNVLKHFKVVHKLKFEFQNVQFKKFAKFDVWKRQLELDTGTHYQLSCAKRIGNLTYNCHHSIKPTIIGTNVIYNVCPANIVVIPTATNYLVHLTKTHLGHEDITLTHSEREQIFEELLGTVSLPIILDEAAEWSRHMQTVHPLHRTLFEIPPICKSHPENGDEASAREGENDLEAEKFKILETVSQTLDKVNTVNGLCSMKYVVDTMDPLLDYVQDSVSLNLTKSYLD